mmetsp:Transcript_4406/g.3691  ORF Transcript_4406/g.3691 Transcript_4406/m.3691 type:complete len:152 (-) Transcript_4406:46-501(-)
MVFQPPSLEIESHDNFRDNYYNTIRAKPQAFYKTNGYFSYFSDKTQREKEVNDIYTRKNISKFQGHLHARTDLEKEGLCSKLQKTYRDSENHSNLGKSPSFQSNGKYKIEANTKYLNTNGWVNKKRKSSQANLSEKSGKKVLTSRRSSNKV